MWSSIPAAASSSGVSAGGPRPASLARHLAAYGNRTKEELQRWTGSAWETRSFTDFLYANRCQLQAVVNPDGTRTEYGFDCAGNLDRVWDANHPSSGQTAIPTTQYSYDDPLVPFSKGRLTAITRNGESVDYIFDRFGRVLQDGALTFSYDANGNRASIEYPGGVVATYSHDFADRELILTISRPGLPDQIVASAATYEPSGPLKTLALGNGTTETRTYTARYFPQRIELTGPQVTFSSTYITDFEGNPTSISDDTEPANNRTYGYQDFQYFLTSGVGAWGNLAWTLDKIGNRLTESRGGLTDTYTYQPNGSGGRTAIVQQITLGVGGTRDYVHGPAGHLELVTAGANQVDFITDAAGRLSRLERAAGDAAAGFRYDGRSFLSSSRAGTVTLFADGFESGDTRCWSETVGAPNAPVSCSPQPETLPVYSSEGLLHALHRNPGQADETRRSTFYFAGRPIAELDRTPLGAETWHWLTTDHLGTPVLATSSAGLELWRGGFEPFGQDFSGASAAGVDLRFPGQWIDETWEEASLGAEIVNNVHRWYQPAGGRYTRSDPLGSQQGFAPWRAYASLASAFSTPFRVNLLTYSQSTPTSFIDEFGLAHCLYRVREHFMTCQFRDGSLKEVGPAGVFSGQGACADNPDCFDKPDLGPVIPGNYMMNRDTRKGRENWLRLEPMPPVRRWEFWKRKGFAFHPGSRSAGCITVSKKDPEALAAWAEIFEGLRDDGDEDQLLVIP